MERLAITGLMFLEEESERWELNPDYATYCSVFLGSCFTFESHSSSAAENGYGLLLIRVL